MRQCVASFQHGGTLERNAGYLIQAQQEAHAVPLTTHDGFDGSTQLRFLLGGNRKVVTCGRIVQGAFVKLEWGDGMRRTAPRIRHGGFALSFRDGFMTRCAHFRARVLLRAEAEELNAQGAA